MARIMYERMERYNEKTGVLKGSHVKLWDPATGKDTDAISYATAEGLGFAQSDILSQVQLGAIKAADEANAAKAAAEAALTDEKAAHAATQMALASTQSKLDTLIAALAKPAV